MQERGRDRLQHRTLADREAVLPLAARSRAGKGQRALRPLAALPQAFGCSATPPGPATRRPREAYPGGAAAFGPGPSFAEAPFRIHLPPASSPGTPPAWRAAGWPRLAPWARGRPRQRCSRRAPGSPPPEGGQPRGRAASPWARAGKASDT